MIVDLIGRSRWVSIRFLVTFNSCLIFEFGIGIGNYELPYFVDIQVERLRINLWKSSLKATNLLAYLMVRVLWVYVKLNALNLIWIYLSKTWNMKTTELRIFLATRASRQLLLICMTVAFIGRLRWISVRFLVVFHSCLISKFGIGIRKYELFDFWVSLQQGHLDSSCWYAWLWSWLAD